MVLGALCIGGSPHSSLTDSITHPRPYVLSPLTLAHSIHSPCTPLGLYLPTCTIRGTHVRIVRILAKESFCLSSRDRVCIHWSTWTSVKTISFLSFSLSLLLSFGVLFL